MENTDERHYHPDAVSRSANPGGSSAGNQQQCAGLRQLAAALPYPRPGGYASQVIAATLSHQRGADLPIDYDHQLVFARENGRPAIAAGWIKKLDVRRDGIWGRVEWTAEAASRLAAREYRYLSLMFIHDGAGNVRRIAGAGLVNMPNLELTALSSQGTAMDPELLAKLKAALGLSPEADEAIALQAIGDLAELAKIICRAAGLPEATPPAGVLSALKTKAGGEGQPNTTTVAAQNTEGKGAPPPGFVPMSALETMAAMHNTFRQQVLGDKVERMVSDVISGGKIPPALRQWASAHATNDPDGFAAFAKDMPAVFAVLSQSLVPGGRPPSDVDTGSGLSAAQLTVCTNMGISPDDYRKTTKETL